MGDRNPIWLKSNALSRPVSPYKHDAEGAFHIAAFFNPTRTKGVYVGIDTDASPTHSAVVLASDPGNKQSDLQGDWMIRSSVT